MPQGLGKKWNLRFSRLHLHDLTFHSVAPVFVVAVGGGGVDWDLTDGVDVLISRPVGDSILAAKRNVQSPVFGVQVGVIEGNLQVDQRSRLANSSRTGTLTFSGLHRHAKKKLAQHLWKLQIPM